MKNWQHADIKASRCPKSLGHICPDEDGDDQGCDGGGAVDSAWLHFKP